MNYLNFLSFPINSSDAGLSWFDAFTAAVFSSVNDASQLSEFEPSDSPEEL